MARGKPHSDETRAAVLAALLGGQSVGAVARDYHIGKTTVLAWRQAAGLREQGSTPVGPEKGAEIGDLLAEYLRENLTTLAVQQRHFRDAGWLAEQSAGELAVLHGVCVDKAVRLLEALQSAEPFPEPDEPAEGSPSPADHAP